MDHEQMALALEASGQYRVLRRFVPAESYQLDDEKVEANRICSVLVVDVETTGLKKGQDRIIDLGMVLAQFDRVSGQVLSVLERYSGFEDPGRPIPEEITRLTGIRDEDVRGQAFDDARVEALIARADLVVAHNAPFDRGFLELRFPSFQKKWWACSQREAPWSQMMTGSTKLEWLAFQIGGCFYDAHRALVDAEVTLFILSQMGPGGRPILSHLLEVSGRKTYCVWAEGAPFEAKDKRNRSLSGVLLPPPSARNNPFHIHQGGAGSDQGDSDQQQVAAASPPGMASSHRAVCREWAGGRAVLRP